jgi:hypothetical protein
VKRREQNAAETPLLRTISLSTWLFMTVTSYPADLLLLNWSLSLYTCAYSISRAK